MKAPQLALLLVPVVALACASDRAPLSGPEDEDDYVLEAVQTVGAAGATVALADFSLSVPAGAFAGDHTLKVLAASTDRPFGHRQVTRSFRIEGLPAEYARPLRVSIKHRGGVSEESYLAVEMEAYPLMADSSATVYELHAAVDSSGSLVSELPPRQAASPSARPGLPRFPADPDGGLNLHGATGLRSRAESHFRITYPGGMVAESAIDELQSLLEDNYAKVVQEIGFDYSERWPQFPVRVILGTWDPPIRAVGACRPEAWSLYVHLDGLTEADIPQLRLDTGRFMLLFAMLGYPQARTFLNNSMEPTHAWFHDAVLVWSEEVFTTDPGYRVPTMFPGFGLAPFRGMAAGAAVSHASHGRGMASVVEYLFTSGRYDFPALIQT